MYRGRRGILTAMVALALVSPLAASPAFAEGVVGETQVTEAALAAPVTDLPHISIQLPEGYGLEDLYASKDEVPVDPDTEPHAVLDLSDPGDPANDLAGATLEEIKSRGNFTWTLDKKPFQIKFDDSTPILGMQAAKTWILLANHADTALLRNKVAYDLAADFGLPGSPDSRFVDLTIDGEFLGNYLLTEKVEVKTNRLEMQDPGGIMLELDLNYGLEEDFNFYTDISNSLFVLKDAVEDVDDPLAPPLAEAYADIQDYLNEFESYLYAADPDWSKISSMIDVESFIKYHFVFEVAANPEIPRSSVFFWKDGAGDVLHAGPVWDFDSAFASYTIERLGGDPVQDYVRNSKALRGAGNDWFAQLFRNEEFVQLVHDVYEQELEQLVNALPTRIDGYAAEIQQSAEANFARWDDVLGEPSVFGSNGHVVADTWQGEVEYLRDWVATRVAHLADSYGADTPIMRYSAHVAQLGWRPALTSGQIAGTLGQSLRLEALDLSMFGNGFDGSFESNSHVQNVGWSGWRDDDALVGTTGRALRLEAVRLRLTDELSTLYDVSYRAHVQNIGWMGWVENGAVAGTVGQSLQIEAIQVRLLEKSEPIEDPSVEYRAHVANIGWMETVADGQTAGTTGRSLAMEALQAEVVDTGLSGDLEYRGHVQMIGWMPWTDSDDYIGTVGQSRRLEAVQIRLTGELAEQYSIRYRAHVQDIGWQSFVADGQTAGTTGQSRRVEAIQIELVPKGP